MKREIDNCNCTEVPRKRAPVYIGLLRELNDTNFRMVDRELKEMRGIEIDHSVKTIMSECKQEKARLEREWMEMGAEEREKARGTESDPSTYTIPEEAEVRQYATEGADRIRELMLQSRRETIENLERMAKENGEEGMTWDDDEDDNDNDETSIKRRPFKLSRNFFTDSVRRSMCEAAEDLKLHGRGFVGPRFSILVIEGTGRALRGFEDRMPRWRHMAIDENCEDLSEAQRIDMKLSLNAVMGDYYYMLLERMRLSVHAFGPLDFEEAKTEDEMEALFKRIGMGSEWKTVLFTERMCNPGKILVEPKEIGIILDVK